jgi:hypothetical protein
MAEPLPGRGTSRGISAMKYFFISGFYSSDDGKKWCACRGTASATVCFDLCVIEAQMAQSMAKKKGFNGSLTITHWKEISWKEYCLSDPEKRQLLENKEAQCIP